ncbi:iron exporter MbfA [Nitrospirillum amazonense]|uniref:Rubrerythrin n=1 Tax=Nitrospirillum amazonense TaxID=28077 RepID=A0A560KI26_9PROT|nr:ferritin family protein [Nitrospirillum amazonense]MDG3444475.1 ferritin family protein [Nitrospirillum amazonense]MEC4592514.1 ferritin family protein [Nitrospirillum amazonense]TWB82921.1 rubrerythrin [Nitrospirillum amazonense]
MKDFSDLTEQELLALAVSLEEEDARIYDEFATGLRENFPESAKVFNALAAEENGHRHRLIELYRQRFGEHIPLIRRQDVRGFVQRKPVWLIRPLSLETVRQQAELMEAETKRFYTRAARRSTDAAIRQLLGDLADEERRHEARAEQLESRLVTPQVREEEHASERRLFVLQVVQPGLAGLMDGSVSTLAPLFAAAFATHDTWQTFLVGIASAVGAGISMGFAEALSDDGSLTGRGSPWLRGLVCGIMTAVGGLGHTLPYLIPQFWTATAAAAAVVVVELGVISWIRNRYMDTTFLAAAFQVIIGGLLVFATGILIGSA